MKEKCKSNIRNLVTRVTNIKGINFIILKVNSDAIVFYLATKDLVDLFKLPSIFYLL